MFVEDVLLGILASHPRAEEPYSRGSAIFFSGRMRVAVFDKATGQASTTAFTPSDVTCRA